MANFEGHGVNCDAFVGTAAAVAVRPSIRPTDLRSVCHRFAASTRCAAMLAPRLLGDNHAGALWRSRPGARSVIRKSRVVVLCIGLSIVLTASGAARDPKIACGELPSNILVEPLLQSAVMSLMRQSETFRRQCVTIAAARRFRVRIVSVSPRSLVSSARAHATFTRYEYGMVRAVIEIPIASDYAELIPHEFEHVIEMIEGIDHAQRAGSSGSGVVEVERGSFETARATEAGLAASREVHGNTDEAVRRTGRQIGRVWRAISARAVPDGGGRAGPASRW
jgi:hypothetical protein